MARCGCAGSTCNCLIEGGLYIAVTGSGTLNDPYIVSSDGVDISDALGFIDTATVNFTLSGAGKDTDPWTVRADATVRVQDLTNVNCASPADGDTLVFQSSGNHWVCGKPVLSLNDLSDTTVPTPAPNNVLTWNGTAWIDAPMSATPGTVVTGPSITGDGSPANPFNINIFTTGPEWQLSGAGSQTNPLTSSLYLGADVNPGSALQDTYPLGFSRMSLSSAYAAANGWVPNFRSSQATTGFEVFTLRRSGNQAVQWLLGGVPSSGPAGWFRVGTATAWGNWRVWIGTGLPLAEATGTISLTPPSGGGTTSGTVMLPANRFQTAAIGGPLRCQACANSATPYDHNVSIGTLVPPDSFDVFMYRRNDYTTGVHWLAMQGLEVI